MEVYELLKQYAQETNVPEDPDSSTPVLGFGLSLFHSCLVEAGLDAEEISGNPLVCARPENIKPDCLSRFVVCYIPFKQGKESYETNEILFEIFSLLKWMDKREISHGLSGIDFQKSVKDYMGQRERCRQLSGFIDEAAAKILEDPPNIINALHCVLEVEKTRRDFVHVSGEDLAESIRFRLPDQAIKLIRENDRLDLILGDTSEKWVILEGGDVFPGVATDSPQLS
jgi:hypothetical protein